MPILSWKAAIIKVLIDAKKELHYKEITKLIYENGYRKDGGATPELTVNKTIGSNIIEYKEKSNFVKVGIGIFILRKYYNEKYQNNDIEEIQIQIQKQIIKKNYMTKKITRPASLVKQGDLILYATSLKVSDLLIKGFYNIEQLDPENASEKGYQRLLNKARAKKLADYMVAGQDTKDAFLPTSIFIATDKNISFNPNNNTTQKSQTNVQNFFMTSCTKNRMIILSLRDFSQ